MDDRPSMTCPSEDDLALRVDDALPPEGAAEVDAHAAACAACAATLEALRALDSALAAAEPLPARLAERLLSISEAPAPAGAGARRWSAAGLAAAAAIVLALAIRPWEPSAPSPRPADPETAETPGTGPSDPPPTVPEPRSQPLVVLHRLARSADPVRAREALRRLGALGRRESLPVLLEVLDREDRRLEAIRALGAIGDPRAVGGLEPLLRDEALGAEALLATVRIGGDAAARALERAIEAAPDEEAWPLVMALGRVDGLGGCRGLLRLLERPGLSSTARAALRAHEARLLPHLLADAGGASRRHARRALEGLEVLAPPAAVPTLAGLLRMRERREHAARVLARIDTPEAAAALWAALPDPEVRAAHRRGGRGIEAWLRERLGTDDRRAQVRAIDLLGLCGGSRSVPPLAALAADPALAPHVVTALGRIGGEAAARALGRLAARPALRRPAVEALGFTGSVAAVGEILRLAEGERTLRDPAIAALSRIPAPEAVEAIVRLEGGPRMRSRTLHALSGMDPDVVVPALHALLEGGLAERARRALAMLERLSPDGPSGALPR